MWWFWCSSYWILFRVYALCRFLAHLSQRLTGELIGYSWSGVRPSVVVHNVQTSYSPKPLCQSKPNFMWSLLGLGERYFIRGMWVKWPTWPPRPYMVKPFKSLLLQNRQADFHETWYVASVTPAHHSLFRWWPWSDLDLFYGKVKFGNLGFSIGKSVNNAFFRNYCSQWPES